MGMYDRADLYDRLYAGKDYAGEALAVGDLLAARGVRDGSRVLEGGCGTGAHLAHLAARYAVEGFDLAPAMVYAARARLPGAPVRVADLSDFRVDGEFDAFLCLFSAFGYLISDGQIAGSARSIARALRPGGVALIEPWLAAARVDDGRVALDVVDEPDLKVCRACRVSQLGEVTELAFAWTVARRGAPIERFDEVHRLRCADPEALVATFADAGFDAAFDASYGTRGLLVAVRR